MLCKLFIGQKFEDLFENTQQIKCFRDALKTIYRATRGISFLLHFQNQYSVHFMPVMYFIKYSYFIAYSNDDLSTDDEYDEGVIEKKQQ